MGHDKAMLMLGDMTLLGRVVRELSVVEQLQHVVVVGSRTKVPEDALGSGAGASAAAGHAVHFVDDRWPGEGPLGGLVTGLGFLNDLQVLGPDPASPLPGQASPLIGTVAVLSCDLPKLTGASVEQLFETLEQELEKLLTPDGAPNLDFVMSARDGRPQPLHGVLRQSVYPMLRRHFLGGERRLGAAIADLRIAVVPDETGSSDDADTPEEWLRLTGGPEIEV